VVVVVVVVVVSATSPLTLAWDTQEQEQCRNLLFSVLLKRAQLYLDAWGQSEALIAQVRARRSTHRTADRAAPPSQGKLNVASVCGRDRRKTYDLADIILFDSLS
jgi:hypothetical protein